MNKQVTVRPISQADFEKLQQAGGYIGQYGRNISRWTEKEYVQVEDCYVFEKDGVLLGGVCFCDDTDEEMEILDFALEPISADGFKWLEAAVKQAARPATVKISYNAC
ncbi:MAG: hypothetical protein FWB91_00940 [Defluviitaleaceae bacterium]|nr:hypothetical protein [Defluviitaleaceae bacterium]